MDAWRVHVGPFVDLDAQAAVGPGVGRAGDAAVLAGQRDGAAAARQTHLPGDLGHRAHAGVLAVADGDEEDPLGLTDLHGLPPDEAVQSLVHTATTLTKAALG